jgi:hypothetical protein
MNASGSRPSSRARVSLISSTAEAPSGDRRGVAGGERAVLGERGFQGRQLLERGVGPRAGVLIHALHGNDLARETLARRDRVPVARERDLVLSLARDLPLPARDLHVLAHRQPGRGLLERGGVGSREPLDAAGDAAVDTPARDRVRDQRRGAKAGDAIGRHGLRFDGGRQAGLEHDLAREVRLPALGHHDAERERVDATRIHGMAFDETAHRVLRQRQRSQGRE